MNKVTEALKVAKKCQKCGGLLEPKFGDYHPICNPENAVDELHEERSNTK